MTTAKMTDTEIGAFHSDKGRLDALREASLASTSELHLNGALDSLVRCAIDLTESDGGHLYMKGKNGLQPIIAIGDAAYREAPLAQEALTFAEGILQKTSPTLETRAVGSVMSGSPERSGSEKPVSLVGISLGEADHPIGVLALVALAPDAYGDEDRTCLQALSSLAARLVQQAAVHKAAVQRAEHVAIVNRVAHAVGGTLHLEDLTRSVYREIEAAFDLDAFFLALYDEDREELDYCLQIDDDTAAPRERRPLGESLTAAVIRGREPLLVRDFAAERESLPSAELWGTMEMPRSWLGVPMHVDDHPLGVISIQAYRTHAYDEADQELLTDIAAHVAVGLKNTQLYEQTSRRLAQCQVLREVMLAAASTLDFDLVLERTIQALHTTVGAESLGFAIPDQEHKWLEVHPSQIGYPPEAEKVVIELDKSVCGRVFLTGEPMIINDVHQAPFYYEALPETRSEIAIPVIVHGEAAGILNVESSSPSAFTDEDLDFYITIASQLSVALENARLFEAERRQRRQTEALEEAAAIVSGTLNLDRVLDHILEQVERVVPGDAFNIVLIKDDNRAEVVGRRGYTVEEWGVRSLSVSEYPLLLQMIETGKPVVVPDTSAEPRWIQEERQEPWRSYVGAPIKVGGVVVGFLNVNSIEPGAFSAQHGQGLQAFAHHAATAIENAQLYEELHRYADALEMRVEERTSQVRSQYAQLETILDSTTDGIILAGPAGELVLANPVARRWLRQELSPRESDQLRDAVKAMAARAEEKPEIVLELTGLDLQLTAAPVDRPTHSEAKAVVAIHDVSHLKTLNRMKSRFVSNVSHELRTPIATIKLLAHLMHEQPEKWQEYLEPLIREAEHQAKLVRGILEMSRVDAGRLEIHMEPTNLNDLVGIALDKYGTQTETHGISLEHALADPDPVAMADSRWLMQVLDNLLSNALRYTPEGGTISVTTDSEMSSGRPWATVTVSDTGIGIPEDELPYIFDRFFRGEKPQMMQVSGTGLGLAILKEIVELHGGQVTVESTVDEGSSFTVWLPAESA